MQDLIGDVVQSNQKESEEVDIEHDMVAMVAAEIHMYFSISNKKFPKPGNLVSGWWNEQCRKCLVEATATLLASKHRSGGLECDFDSLDYIITPKRLSLGGGFAEVLMMLKLNKHLMPYDPK